MQVARQCFKIFDVLNPNFPQYHTSLKYFNFPKLLINIYRKTVKKKSATPCIFVNVY